MGIEREKIITALGKTGVVAGLVGMVIGWGGLTYEGMQLKDAKPLIEYVGHEERLDELPNKCRIHVRRTLNYSYLHYGSAIPLTLSLLTLIPPCSLWRKDARQV